MTNQNDERLGTEKISKLLFSLALPSIVAQMVNVLYNMIDRMYIGHIPEIGSLALTGIGVCMPVILTISAFAVLVGMGSSPMASIAMGKEDNEKAEKLLGNCAVALLIISLILTVVFHFYREPLLMLFGASDNTFQYANDYMRIYTYGTIFVQLTLGLNVFITAQGLTKISMRTTLIGAICNIILDPIFIFGLDMGVRGAALATVISQAISAIWVLRFLTGSKTKLRLQAKNLRLSPKIILPCLGLGLAPFIMQITESVITACYNSSLERYGGDIAVGTMTILSTVMQFSTLPLLGLTQGSQPIISYNFGAKNAERVKQTFGLLIKSALCYSTLLWLVAMIAPKAYILIFTNEPELIENAVWAMRIYMAVLCILGIQVACQQTFVAIGNAKAAVFLALLRKVILLIPMIYILPRFFENKVFGVFLAQPLTDIIAILTTATLFFIQFRKALNSLENN